MNGYHIAGIDVVTLTIAFIVMIDRLLKLGQGSLKIKAISLLERVCIS